MKWVACYCVMQKNTRYQNAEGVDFQMLRHYIIADIVRWSVPEKKKIHKCQRSPRLVNGVWQVPRYGPET